MSFAGLKWWGLCGLRTDSKLPLACKRCDHARGAGVWCTWIRGWRCLMPRQRDCLTCRQYRGQWRRAESYQHHFHRLQCQPWDKIKTYTMVPVSTLSFSVINAFWVGRHLQQMTAGAFRATSKKSEELAVLRMLVRAGPSTSNTCWEGSYSISLVLNNWKIKQKLQARLNPWLRGFTGWRFWGRHWWQCTWQSRLYPQWASRS